MSTRLHTMRSILWGLAGLVVGFFLAGAYNGGAPPSSTRTLVFAGGAVLVIAAAVALAPSRSPVVAHPFDGRRTSSLLFILSVALGWSVLSWDALAQAAPAGRATGNEVLQFEGGTAKFPHAAHMERMADQCGVCHHAGINGESSTACARCHADLVRPTRIFAHERHVGALGGNASCRSCHAAGQPHTAPGAARCRECHPAPFETSAPAPAYASVDAPGFADAAHRVCRECHAREAARPEARRSDLARCSICHANARFDVVN